MQSIELQQHISVVERVEEGAAGEERRDSPSLIIALLLIIIGGNMHDGPEDEGLSSRAASYLWRALDNDWGDKRAPTRGAGRLLHRLILSSGRIFPIELFIVLCILLLFGTKGNKVRRHHCLQGIA